MPAVSLTSLQQQIAQSERELRTLSQELESRLNHLAELTRRKEALQTQLRQAQDVLDYARQCKRQRPEISDEELRAFLEAKFIKNIDPLAAALARGVSVGAINNPLDWLWGFHRFVKESVVCGIRLGRMLLGSGTSSMASLSLFEKSRRQPDTTEVGAVGRT